MQLRGLALARKGYWQSAKDVLSILYEQGEQDPETLGIYARTWKDRYQESKDSLHLEKACSLYELAFRNAPRDYYTGVNAAATNVMLGQLDKAAALAGEVEEIVGTTEKPSDYWMTATVAEVQL